MTSAPHTMLQFDITGWEPARVAGLIAAAESQPDTGSLFHDSLATEGIEPSGWGQEDLHKVRSGLKNSRADVQIRVLEQAARNGGFISREQTYQVAGWDPQGRSLKGLTRPVNRVISKLQDSGEISAEVEELMQPVYSPTASGYSRALGFRIPADVCALLLN